MDTSPPQFDTSILKKAGLTESQARGYLALIQNGTLTPVELAAGTGESRTNGYAIADKLVELGLATKKDGVRAVYAAAHPSALEALAEKRRKVVIANERTVKDGMSPLIDLFYAHTEQPGTRVLQGIDGIKSVYEDTLRAPGNEIYLLRTTADEVDLGLNYLNNYRERRAAAGIHTYALTPDTAIARRNRDTEDERMLFHRTMIAPDAYTAPVEIDIYGHKVALIAYGETQMATIITSPPIAEAMRQLFRLVMKRDAPMQRDESVNA